VKGDWRKMHHEFLDWMLKKPEGKRQLGKPKRRWEDINMDIS
jgi:hypothetical protein